MNRKILLMFGVVAVLFTIGAGCTNPATGNKTKSDSATSTSEITVNKTTPINTATIKDSNKDNKDKNDNEDNDEGGLTAVVDIKPGVKIIKTEKGSETIPTLDYSNALNIYSKSGYRFQFSSCSGNLGLLTIKVDTKFMIDNRDNRAHKIGIGNKTYELAAYGFAVVSIPEVGRVNITCDGDGSAYVLVEK